MDIVEKPTPSPVEQFPTQGSTRLLPVWRNMIARCSGLYEVYKSTYTDRGISVCNRWLNFDNFCADMAPRPLGMEIDRIDNDGNYTPSNCRWATKIEQQNNKRTNRRLNVNGITMTASEASRRVEKANAATIRRRLDNGWSSFEAAYWPCKKRA